MTNKKLFDHIQILVAKKKKLYSKMDITKPMSIAEKKLNKRISTLFAELNEQIGEERKKHKK